MDRFEIPKSATCLQQVEALASHTLSDEEIAQSFLQYQPITSEKNVWAFWDKGFDKMYPAYQETVRNWVRMLGPSWTVRIVDLVEGSPNNMYNFVDKSWFPDCVVEGTMDGKHIPQHTSDLLRLPLLYLHGGVWMDVGNMLHTHLDDLFWNHIASPNTPYEVAVWIITGQIKRVWGSFGNFMLAARKGCDFIKYWHLGYKELWRGRTNEVGFHRHPLIRDIGLADGLIDHFGLEHVEAMSDYVAHMLIGDRLRHLVDTKAGWNGHDFFTNKVFKVQGVPNGVLGAVLTDFCGQRQADLFTTRLDEPDEEKRLDAEKFVVEVLEKSNMYKLYHNSAGTLPALGDIIKRDGWRDATQRPGTFGALYRYGCIHWRSTKAVEESVPFGEGLPLVYGTPTESQQYKLGEA